MTFGERLRELREAAGLSAWALAQRAGVAVQTVTRAEADANADPGWRTVQRLALALGVSTEELRDHGLNLPEPRRPKPKGRPRKT
jgi:transcriptional regulator with XRE-family HTH domain